MGTLGDMANVKLDAFKRLRRCIQSPELQKRSENIIIIC